MDFFAHQDRARASTARLLVYYVIALVTLVAVLNVAAALAWRVTLEKHEDVHPINWPMHAIVTLIVGLIVAIATAMKQSEIGDDGANVAELLGGKAITGTPANAGERRLVNVVEEMALASGVPVPRVYVLPKETGINAFAAGTRIDNAVVGVTRGTLDGLTRDQLQGVIAHEFSHIFNGDMRLNLRLIALNFGIGAIGQMAIEVARGFGQSGGSPGGFHSGGGGLPSGGGSSSGSSDGGGGGDKDGAAIVAAVIAFVVLVAIAAAIIGLVGALIGKILQAAVSRQREYLADASAVQYTRNPIGIVGALKRIGGYGSTVRAPAAGQASHMFFCGIGGFLDGLFATHPPLVSRIRAIEPSFDGQMTPAAVPTPHDEPTAADALAFAPRGGPRVAPPPLPLEGERVVADADFAAHAAAPAALVDDPARRAAPLDAAIPDEIRAAAREPFSARAVALALLLDRNADVRDRQFMAIFVVDEQAATLASSYVGLVAAAGPAGRLPMLELALPAIRRLSPTQQQSFRALCRTLAAADQHLAPFELTMLRMIDNALPADAGAATDRGVRFASVSSVAEQAGVLLSVIANAGGPEQARRAFDAGIAKLKLPRPPLFTVGFDAEAFERALATLRRATPAVRYRVVDAAATAVAIDGTVRIEEMELMRAACAAFGVPVPPNLRVSR